ncbi:MAG TPA: bile acid:sodium symporter family protein [Gammaproteobacteria bacterium]|nr:bile acid:sodium symporter family protein [Gammaproteobacteria bacterium]
MESGFPIAVALPAVIVSMMLVVGMRLRPADFTRLAAAPLAAAVGLANMFVVFPALAFAVAAVFDLSPELRIGLVLLAASPSGSTSTFFTYFARGDVALAVALTTISKAVPVLTIPLYSSIASRVFGGADTSLPIRFADTSESVLTIVLLPMAVGMALLTRYPTAVAALRPHLARGAAITLVAVIAVLAFRERERLPEMAAAAGPAAAALCVLGMLAAFSAAKLLRLSAAQRTAITIETGMQSGGTAIAIAAGLLGSAAMAVPAAIYSLIMYAAAAVFVMAIRIRRPAEASEREAAPVAAHLHPAPRRSP